MADELLPAEERARQLLTEIWGYPRNSDDAAVAAYIIREERQAAFKECEQIVRNFAWMLPKYDSWEVNDATNDAAQSVSKQFANAIASWRRVRDDHVESGNGKQREDSDSGPPKRDATTMPDDPSAREPLRDLQEALRHAALCIERLLEEGSLEPGQK